MKPRILSATSIAGTKVKNLDGNNIGEIQDLMIDFQTRNVVYAVLSFGGFMGIGDKYFAIPVEALNFDSKEERIILDVDKKRLENAPGFDKDNWPMEASPEFVQSIYEHYGYKPRAERPYRR